MNAVIYRWWSQATALAAIFLPLWQYSHVTRVGQNRSSSADLSRNGRRMGAKSWGDEDKQLFLTSDIMTFFWEHYADSSQRLITELHHC